MVSDAMTTSAPSGFAGLLGRHRELTWELTKRDLTDRHAGQWIGAGWSVIHLLALVGIYLFVFAAVLKVRLGADAPGDYGLYVLAGLIPWLAFYDVMTRSCAAVSAQATLVKQIVFPVEVLPLKTALTSVLFQLIGLVVLLLYAVLAHGSLPVTVAWVPVLMVMQFIAMVGVAFLISAIAVFVRDLKDAIQLFGMIGALILPVFYLPEWVPALARPVLTVNPFSHLVWCYQDAIFYGAIRHPVSWIVFPLFAAAAITIGWRVFRYLKPWFGNVL
ncbi:MAG TPA: ABC transporter permease [Nitrospirales bacterium]|nr:ABC transporter permease [Nitrospirales bacterium]